LTDGVFVEIGSEPENEMIKEMGIDLDEQGYVRIQPDGRTSEKGIWAAGDITTGSDKFKQIVTAAAEGAIAANSVQKYLKK
jgi:thioredoxin reductase (NADPH)